MKTDELIVTNGSAIVAMDGGWIGLEVLQRKYFGIMSIVCRFVTEKNKPDWMFLLL